MNILAIGAHPDDIEYGCAGTLINMPNVATTFFSWCSPAAKRAAAPRLGSRNRKLRLRL
jgi:hypothetical protein